MWGVVLPFLVGIPVVAAASPGSDGAVNLDA
eukprot:COSAG03_NODE_15297_length_435_cov_0.860119_1_plen_30_part_10